MDDFIFLVCLQLYAAVWYDVFNCYYIIIEKQEFAEQS